MTYSILEYIWLDSELNIEVRIPIEVKKNKCGYFEDKRPSSSIDPYIATSLLFSTSLNIEQSHFT